MKNKTDIVKMTGYAFFELVDDDPDKIPTVHKTKKDCIDSNRSYHGHPCDDPEKRGVIAKVELVFHVPKQVKATEELLDYIHLNGGPAILFHGDKEGIARQFKEAAERMRRSERKAKKLMSAR